MSNLSSTHDDVPVILEHTFFDIRLANRKRARRHSNLLIERMYSRRGYRSESEDSHRVAEEITLQACRNEKVFGTVTLCLDSPFGLPADALYPSEIDSYRRRGATVCELTRLALDPNFGSKEVLGALFHLTYLAAGPMHGATDVFIEVNPRHVAFYKRMLHFAEAGPCKMCERVNAPAVLMHLAVAHVAEQIARYGGRARRMRSSLYSYFFSQDEQEGLYGRLSSNVCGVYSGGKRDKPVHQTPSNIARLRSYEKDSERAAFDSGRTEQRYASNFQGSRRET